MLFRSRHNLYVRLDFEEAVDGVRIHFNFRAARFDIEVAGKKVEVSGDVAVSAAFGKVLELKVPLAAIQVRPGDRAPLQLSVWEGALPLDAMPRDGWLRLETAEPGDWLI